MKKVWALGPNAPMVVGSLVQSEARFRSVDFPQKEPSGSCGEIGNKHFRRFRNTSRRQLAACVFHSHVFRHGGVGDGGSRRVQAVLAAHAAAVAAEAVHVGMVGVLGAHSPRPRVERVLFIDVVVISLPKRRKEKIQITVKNMEPLKRRSSKDKK